MTSRERLLTVLLGITGIIAAGAIALAANAVSGREIGLSAEPVSLATKAPAPKPSREVEDRRHAEAGDDHGGDDSVEDSGGGPGPSISSGSGGEAGDDNGGDRSSSSGPGSGGDDSSGGSSGSGSSGSGGSGSD
jgi:hypothetical protein